MKKFLALLLSLVMVLALVACGDKKEDANTDDQDNNEVTDFKVGFIMLHDENSTYDLNFINAAKAACEKLGVEYTIVTNVPEGQECYDKAAELADAGRLDKDTIRVELLEHLRQSLAEITYQRAADTAGVQLVDLNASLTHKAAVNADLAEFVFDQHDLFTLERFLDELFDQGRFACTQKAGENINFSYLFCHGNIPFYLKVCLCC